MKKLKGIGVSPGIVIGKAYPYKKEGLSAVKRAIKKDEIEHELALLNVAKEKTQDEVYKIRGKILEEFPEGFADIFTVHLALLNDPSLLPKVKKRIEEERVNASYAFSETIKEVMANLIFSNNKQAIRMIDVIHDISEKMLHYLGEREGFNLSEIHEKVVLVAKNLTPSETVQLSKEKVCGIVCSLGGQTSHAAILAQALRIPAVLGVHDAENTVSLGETIILDGISGTVIINPTAKDRQAYEEKAKRAEKDTKKRESLLHLPSETTDGHKIKLCANIELPEEARLVKEAMAEGIGLFRTEFMFIERDGMPCEDEQEKVYSMVAKKSHPHPVTIRTLDLGGDKLSFVLRQEEENPFLGLRAIRFCLKYKDIFKTQLRAILRSSSQGRVRVMFPMVSSQEELTDALILLSVAKEELRREGIPFDEEMEVGIMIETPSAALTADLLAPLVDFFSIGTNDLIQYTMAIDRVNPELAYLYQPLHPAILRLIKAVVDVAHKNDILVGMCGEMASDPLYSILLLGLGLDEFSVGWCAISKIKEVIRAVSYQEAKRLAEKALLLDSAQKIEALLKKNFPQELREMIRK
ncbi:phosphoenolpyruvate--protein phosphotransferase [bacterium]|nr:phosphoenolpyruvate--protein phosphotransferase [bacterium]MBU2462154.1 phosphoenolpyruvate--protein phosphotransferase [bacterium]